MVQACVQLFVTDDERDDVQVSKYTDSVQLRNMKTQQQIPVHYIVGSKDIVDVTLSPKHKMTSKTKKPSIQPESRD